MDKTMWDTVEWLFGLAFLGVVAAIGHIHVRVNRVEDREGKSAEKAEAVAQGLQERSERETEKLWKAFTDQNKEFQDFKGKILEDYPSKADLRATEERISTLIRDKMAVVAGNNKGVKNG